MRSKGVASTSRNVFPNAKVESDNMAVNSVADQPRQRRRVRNQSMGVLTTRLAAKPVATTGLADKAPWFQPFDVKSLWDPLSLGFVLVAIALALFTFRDYGVTWD